MFESKLKSVVELEAKAREARVELENTRVQELKALPARYGYESLDEFVKALREAAGKRGPRAGKKVKAPKAAGGKRRRAKITPEMREQIIADLKAGQKTAVAISKQYQVSYPTIMSIKKAAGLIGDAPAAPVAAV